MKKSFVRGLLVLMVLAVCVQAGTEKFEDAVIGDAPKTDNNKQAILLENIDLGLTSWWTGQGFGDRMGISPVDGPDGKYVTLVGETKFSRCLMHVKKDMKATTGIQTLEMDVLFTQGNMAVRVIGIQDAEDDGWLGGIQGSGGAGNFGSEQCCDYRTAPDYTHTSPFPEDGTRVFTATWRQDEIEYNTEWQHLSFEVDLGEGYDWVLITIGQALNEAGLTVEDNLTRIGIDNISFPTIDSATVVAANPANGSDVTVSPSVIDFSWTVEGDVAVDSYDFLLTTDPNLDNLEAQLVNATVLPADAAGEDPVAPQADNTGSYSFDNGEDFPYETTYYWYVTANVLEPNPANLLPIPEPNIVYSTPAVIESEFTFTTESATPVVNAGDDDYTWLDGATGVLTLAGDVFDADNTLEEITLLWTVEAQPEGANAVIVPDNTLDPVATFDIAGNYTLTLSAADFNHDPVTDSVVITVYEDECAAAKAENGYNHNPAMALGDLNYDCKTTITDLAILAANWLDITPGRVIVE